MDRIRAEKFQQLIDLLHEADALQQELLAVEDESACYLFHTQLNDLADEFCHMGGGTGCAGNDAPVRGIPSPSTATSEPKLWRDMTPEEKGALLLAHLEGKVIESDYGIGVWGKATALGIQGNAYRIRPEPQRVTVDLMADFKVIGRIDLIDGKPDVTSIKMEDWG